MYVATMERMILWGLRRDRVKFNIEVHNDIGVFSFVTHLSANLQRVN